MRGTSCSRRFRYCRKPTKHNGGPGYAKTVTVFVPKLRVAGVDEKTLHRILVDNPLRLLSFVPKR